jgi:hypothetical protein
MQYGIPRYRFLPEHLLLVATACLQPVLDQAELESLGVEAAVSAMRSHAQAVEEQAFYDSLVVRMAAALKVRKAVLPWRYATAQQRFYGCSSSSRYHALCNENLEFCSTWEGLHLSLQSLPACMLTPAMPYSTAGRVSRYLCCSPAQ